MKPETGAGDGGCAPGLSGRMAPPQIPDAWRSFLERFNQGGPDPVPDGARFLPSSFSNEAGSDRRAVAASAAP